MYILQVLFERKEATQSSEHNTSSSNFNKTNRKSSALTLNSKDKPVLYESTRILASNLLEYDGPERKTTIASSANIALTDSGVS